MRTGPFSWDTAAPEPLTMNAIGAEVVKARLKFPGREHLMLALAEEHGELAKAILQREGRDKIEREALQVIAVAIRIIEEGDPVEDRITDAQAKK